MLTRFLTKSIWGLLLTVAMPGVAQGLPKVVATTSVICDLTDQIAQDTIDLNCLVKPGIDPHVYQPTPQDRQAIETAQLLLYGGYNFDASLIKLIEASNNPAPRVAVHEKAVPNPLMASGDEHHDHDHHHGEETGEMVPDPHVWHDPKHGIAMVRVIADQLSTLQPELADQYQAQAEAIALELTQIDAWITDQINTIAPEQRKLVTTHDALGYYVAAYDLQFEGALSGISTEESPSAARVGQLVGEIKASGVPTIFAESSVNPRLIETVAREAQVQVSPRELYTDSLGEPGTPGETYQKMLISNTETIVTGLEGSYTAFQP